MKLKKHSLILKQDKRPWDNQITTKIAIPTEFAIVKDYSGVFRKRGKDTYVKHLDHSDIGCFLGIIRFHSAPSDIRFDQHGDIIGQTDPGSLHYITYGNQNTANRAKSNGFMQFPFGNWIPNSYAKQPLVMTENNLLKNSMFCKIQY